MCGIGGYFSFSDKVPDKEVLNNLLTALEQRGSDATGVSFIDESNKLVVIKENIKATNFISTNYLWKNLEKLPSYMIMHTRQATKGSAINSSNNHPVYRNGLALVHNGIITNDDELYEERKFKRDGQVDTEVILALLEINKDKTDWLARVSELNNLNGSFAVAAIDTEIRDTICLFRHSSPIVIGIDETNDILYFASTEHILSKAIVRNYKGLCDIPVKLGFYDMPNDYGLVIDKAGPKSKFKLDIKYSKNYTKYEKRKHSSLAVNNKENCTNCGKLSTCPDKYAATSGVVVRCGRYVKLNVDECLTCKVKTECTSPTTNFETMKHLMCKKLTTNPHIYCSDCTFAGCMYSLFGKGSPSTCHYFKYKTSESEHNKKCKTCTTYTECADKFELEGECASFVKEGSKLMDCVYLTQCGTCDPVNCDAQTFFH